MKKFFAVLLLIICTFAAALAASAFMEVMFFLTGGIAAAVMFALVPFCAMGCGYSFWERKFAKKFSVKTPAFALISFIPPVIAAGACWAVCAYLNNSGYFKGMLGGIFELTFTVSLTITAVIFPVSGMVWHMIIKNTKNI